MKKPILYLAFAVFTLPAFSQTTSWVGAADSTWDNPTNWTSGVPTAALDAILGDANFSGPNAPVIKSAATCRGLTINAGNVLKVNTSSDLVVAGSFTNDGTITGDSISIKFVGNATVNGSGTAVYDHFKVISGASITLNKTIEIEGDLIVDGTFAAAGKTIVFTGNSASAISGSGNITLGNLTINKTGADITLLTSVTLTGALTLNTGRIHTTMANLLTLSAAATSTSGNASSFVDGPMQKIGNTAFVFPLGNNGVWARLGVSAPTLAGDAFIAQYFAAPYTNTDSIAVSSPVMNNVSKIEYWTCERSAGSSDVSVTLYWEDNARSDFDDFNNLAVAHWNGSKWVHAGNTSLVSGAQGNITSSVQTSFSPFTFGSTSNANPMPVKLLTFEAKENPEKHVALSWATATETNNDHFTLERSTDGLHFSTVAIVKGSGTTLLKNEYKYTDVSAGTGTFYYRLKQTDHNGLYEYLGVRMVEISKPRADFGVYPNPCSGSTFTVNVGEHAAGSRLTVLNAMGAEVLKREITDEGSLEVYPEKPLPGGMYTVLVSDGAMTQAKRLIIR